MDLAALLADDTSLLESGWEVEQKADAAFCTPDTLITPDPEPAACAGPTVTLAIDGGACTVGHDGTVTCAPATVRLITTPAACTLHRKPPQVLKV